MKRNGNIILLLCTIAVLTAGCTGSERGDNAASHPTERLQAGGQNPGVTVYTQQAAMNIYGYQPERALRIIDSALIVGNINELWHDVNRARIYSQSQMAEQLDSLLGGPEGVRLDTARAIAERLMQHDSVKAGPMLRQNVLEILIYTARKQEDTVRWLQRSRQLVEECRKHGKETKALRTEAEIGASLCLSGQQAEGMVLLDSAITALSSLEPFRFLELDALIIAAKRKISVLAALGREEETLPVARRIIDLLDDYEQHPDHYHDGSYREPANDAKRADYIRFYRSQAQGFITSAYAALGDRGGMTETMERIERIVRDAMAREHTARYRALQQQIETERRQQATEARAERNLLVAVIVGILFVAALAALLWSHRQQHIISLKNRVLARQIDEIMKYKEKYNSVYEEPATTSTPQAPNLMTDEQLFQHINAEIVSQRLFLDPNFNRQKLIDRFRLSKNRVGAVFAKGSAHDGLTNYLQQLRLEHAIRLLVEQPSRSITQVASDSGFSSANYFGRLFRQHFGMTPTEYRMSQRES